MREPNRFVLDHLHGAQWVGLELHSSLLKPRAGMGVGPGPLVGRPWLGRVRGLREICDRGLDGVSRDGGLGRVSWNGRRRRGEPNEAPARARENSSAAEHGCLDFARKEWKRLEKELSRDL